jgi:hypothetical protein
MGFARGRLSAAPRLALFACAICAACGLACLIVYALWLFATEYKAAFEVFAPCILLGLVALAALRAFLRSGRGGAAKAIKPRTLASLGLAAALALAFSLGLPALAPYLPGFALTASLMALSFAPLGAGLALSLALSEGKGSAVAASALLSVSACAALALGGAAAGPSGIPAFLLASLLGPACRAALSRASRAVAADPRGFALRALRFPPRAIGAALAAAACAAAISAPLTFLALASAPAYAALCALALAATAVLHGKLGK